MGGTCSAYGREERRIQDFGGETCRKKPLGIPRCRWGDIVVDLQEVEWGALAALIWFKIGTGGGHF
jgi:hypothetical protein